MDGELERENGECCDDGSLHGLFLRCSNIISRRIGRNASRRRIVALLYERGEMTQRELREELGIQAGSLSELVSRMEEHGLLTRHTDEEDRRRTVLCLTPLGVERAKEPRVLGDERLFAALTPREQEELRRMLGKIIDAHMRWRRESERK